MDDETFAPAEPEDVLKAASKKEQRPAHPYATSKGIRLPWNNVRVEARTLFDTKARKSKDGDVWWSYSRVSVYDGKNMDGTYKQRINIDVRFVRGAAPKAVSDLVEGIQAMLWCKLSQWKDKVYLECDYYEVIR